jgi:hypothetical protein
VQDTWGIAARLARRMYAYISPASDVVTSPSKRGTGNCYGNKTTIISFPSRFTDRSERILLDSLTTSMEMSSSREAASCSATQEFPHTSWNPKAHYRVRRNISLAPIQSQINHRKILPKNKGHEIPQSLKD